MSPVEVAFEDAPVDPPKVKSISSGQITVLLRELQSKEDAKFFTFEEDKMYTKRESELIQQFLQKKGSMPRYNDEMDDLF